LGPQTGFYDQPYVDVELRDGNHGLGPYGSVYGLDLYMYNHFLLDTGANAILAAAEATGRLSSFRLRAALRTRILGQRILQALPPRKVRLAPGAHELMGLPCIAGWDSGKIVDSSVGYLLHSLLMRQRRAS